MHRVKGTKKNRVRSCITVSLVGKPSKLSSSLGKLNVDGGMGEEEAEQHSNAVVKNNLRNRKINASVIPAPRKSVKRMMLEEMIQFLTLLLDKARCRFSRNTKRIYYAQTNLS
ncbi:hypothetical protein RIF29_16705 [Crotalaria pallida]|uniref:Uncharacterized protein n=1 Tax=Crotalaria pallida TaxID=3830 RepID=A0AAN9FHU8_CROPI